MSCNTIVSLHNVKKVECMRKVFNKHDDYRDDFDVIKLMVTDVNGATVEIDMFTEKGFQLPEVRNDR